MLLDEDRDYTAEELDRAVEPVDPDDPWDDREGTGNNGNRTDSDGTETDSEADAAGETAADDGHGSLSDFSE